MLETFLRAETAIYMLVNNFVLSMFMPNSVCQGEGALGSKIRHLETSLENFGKLNIKTFKDF